MTVPDHREAPGCPYTRAQGSPLYGAAVAENPHSLYARLRAQHGPVAPIELEPGVEAWLVLGYPEMLELTRNEQLFSKDSRRWRVQQEGRLRADSHLIPMTTWRPTLQSMDGAAHQRLSTAVADTLARIDHHLLRATTEDAALRLIESWGPDGTADLISQFTKRLPLLVFTRLLGLPAEDGPHLVGLITDLVDSSKDSQRAAAEFFGLLTDLVLSRRERPGADLASWLLTHPVGLSDEEVVHHLMVILVAGNEPCINWIGNTVRLLLTDRRFRTTLTGGRATVADALDEVLWRDPPVQNFPGRWAVSDTVLGGQYISAGDMLVLGLAGANDDPAAHGPDGIAGNRAHLAWGAGRHVCPAQDPARLIVETAIETLLHCLPDLQLAVPAHELTWRPSPWSRALVSLPVLYSAFVPPRPAPPEETAWTPPPTSYGPSGSTPSGPTSTPRTSGSAPTVRPRWWSSLAGWWSGR
ncbi:cytochrome P450 [Kitasatospora cheerisanensis KCTC 2395]|uniref:Cytochrome P450 n=1 Tax=Kitasatospora cheerisanensis KCTC 2395 TaxID=1348663 RepID=A0A066YT81_9ACTN|nr:cytochrome P450 [Kitasatospora cheerisanensis KCTC 2395]